MLKVHIRWMIKRDMPEVMAIEAAGFEFPWTEKEFEDVLRHRNCIGMAAEWGDKKSQVVGFMVYELNRTHLKLLNFAVCRHFRRLGIGRQLMEKLVGKLNPGRRERIEAMLRETNFGGLMFAKSVGMVADQLVRSPYVETDEDGIRLRFDLERSAVSSRVINRVKSLQGGVQ